jgi:hypothetical protein
MRQYAFAALAAASLALAACGGGEQAADNEATDGLPGQSVNAADGSINLTEDASGTTGSTTGDAGGPLNVVGDAVGDANEANSTDANAQ